MLEKIASNSNEINETLTERRVYKTLVEACKTFSR